MKKVNIALLGFGTVGAGIVSLLHENKKHILEKSGVDICLKKIVDADIQRKRTVTVESSLLTTKAEEVMDDPSVSIVIEAIGGTEPAFGLVKSALKKKKNVVTTNKELIAKHGTELLKTAAENGVSLRFEGSVCGGIPVINQLRTTLSANKIEEISGIVNGTTNYILSKMTEEGKEFAEALKEAQARGYAEADPKSDIEGFDASYKAAILAMTAFDVKVKWEDLYFEGISKISLDDILLAKEFGYVIKLLAVAKHRGGSIEVRVHPALIKEGHPLASVSGAYNAIYIRGNAVGEVMLYGKGAGGLPTASSAVSDVIEIASGPEKAYEPELKDMKLMDISDTESRFFIRLKVKDQPGVLAGIAGAFGSNNVSIQNALQKDTVDNIATLVIITHKVKEKNISDSLAQISRLSTVSGIGSVIRVGMEQ